MSARIVTLDIETAPHLGHVWGLWQQNVGLNQIKAVSHVMSFAAKWYGEKELEFYSDFHNGHEDMVKAAHSVLDEADIVVHYNGTSFDIPHLQREFVLAGLTPPKPFKQVDLLQVARKQFNFASNKLEHVATQLGVGGKVSTGGFELWLDCLAGDEQAWAKMRRYNINDVRITERVYEKLLPWITQHPHLGLYTEDPTENICGRCGSSRVQKRGTTTTALSVFQIYWCRDCGGWSRVAKRTAGVDLRPTA